MANTQIHMADAGIDFIDTIMDDDGVVDLSEVSLIEYHFQKPDSTWFSHPGLLFSDGTDGKVRYSSVSSDFDQSGTWRYQVYLVIGPDEKHTDIGKFRVYPNIPLEG